MSFKLQHLPHIGLRKLKSILGLFVGFWIWQGIRVFFPELEIHPIYIYFYSLIEIRDSSKKTVSMGRLRLKSTAIALVLGLIFLALTDGIKTLLPPEAWMHTAVELAMILLGSLLTLVVAECLGCEAFCGLAAAMFILMIVLHANDQRYGYTLLRASQTVIGVGTAWLINVKLFPYTGPGETKGK